MKKSAQFLLSILFIIILSSLGYLESQDHYKKIHPLYLYPIGDINITNDSVRFNGYMIFRIEEFPDTSVLHIDAKYYQCEIYWIDDLKDIENITNRFWYNLGHISYSLYAFANYDTIKKVDTSMIYNKVNFHVMRKFKAFYSKYLIDSSFNYSNPRFLGKTLSTEIFLESNADFWSYSSDDSIGYFIFDCSFNAAILQYNCYYLKNEDMKQKIFLDNVQVLLPLSTSYLFQPTPEAILVNAGFKRAKWYPKDLYNEIK